METLKKYWIYLVLAAVGIWWFFTGDTPVNLLKDLVGRGRRLSLTTSDSDGNVLENVDDLVEAASALLGRPVSKDAYILARISRSEHGSAGQKEKALIQRVCMNDAAMHGWSIWFTATSDKGFGRQRGRRYSTAQDPYEDDLAIAEENLAGELADDSSGATHFVHKTGFKTITEYREICDKWYREAGIVPVDVGGVSSLMIFLPESQVQNG